MNQGKDYAAAWEATRATGAIYSREQIANATRAEAAMNEGKDYVSAREAAQRAQPTKVQASTVGATLTIK